MNQVTEILPDVFVIEVPKWAKISIQQRSFSLGFDSGYNLRDEEVEALNEIIGLKEYERKNWADLTIKKQQEIERLKMLIARMFLDNLHNGRDISAEFANECWQDFKAKNNL